jgi:hypothetical protein
MINSHHFQVNNSEKKIKLELEYFNEKRIIYSI